jgi:hypothetical protein
MALRNEISSFLCAKILKKISLRSQVSRPDPIKIYLATARPGQA